MTRIQAKDHMAADDNREGPGPLSVDGFNRNQLRKLTRDVDPRFVHQRDIDGRQLSYIEGWYAIAQANKIFGFGGWDRETMHSEPIKEKGGEDAVTVGYVARVRIRVRAGAAEILREGIGFGSVSAAGSAAAHERAVKAAETDATKRALATFGPSFGLTLYDKDRASKPRPVFELFDPDGLSLDARLSPEAYCTGLKQLIGLCETADQLNRLLRNNSKQLTRLRNNVPSLRNSQGSHFADLLERLIDRRRIHLGASAQSPVGLAASILPARSETGMALRNIPYARRTGHRRYPAILSIDPEIPLNISATHGMEGSPRFIQSENAVGSEANEVDEIVNPNVQAGALPNPAASPGGGSSPQPVIIPVGGSPLAVEGPATTNESESEKSPEGPLGLLPSRIANGDRIDKSRLRLPLERRLRDKSHLKRVGELPCLICNRQPSHAHHLRFAQQRGLAQKVSDEFVVPLCALHHGDLHRSSSEKEWWSRQKIDPLPVSRDLWAASH